RPQLGEPVRHQSQRGGLPGREEVADAGSHATRGDAALAFHIEPPASTGPQSCVQTFPGPDLAGGGPILYRVVRASTRAPIQSGPLRFARCLGRKGTSSLWPSRARGCLVPITARARLPASLPNGARQPVTRRARARPTALPR
ncbi:hypothetical protein CDV58_09473, partial [Aspergillus fumigatus]